jgi:F-box-like
MQGAREVLDRFKTVGRERGRDAIFFSLNRRFESANSHNALAASRFQGALSKSLSFKLACVGFRACRGQGRLPKEERCVFFLKKSQRKRGSFLGRPVHNARLTMTELPFLPPEVFVQAFANLPLPDLDAAAAVCRQWRDSACDDVLWEPLFDSRFHGRHGAGPREGSRTGARRAYSRHNRLAARWRQLCTGELKLDSPGIKCQTLKSVARGPSTCVAFEKGTARPTFVAAGTSDRQTAVWNCRSGERLATLRGFRAHVACVTFLEHDSTSVASGSANYIKLHNVERPRACFR